MSAQVCLEEDYALEVWSVTHSGQETDIHLRASIWQEGAAICSAICRLLLVSFPERATVAAVGGVKLCWWEPTAAPLAIFMLNPEGSPLSWFRQGSSF